MKYAADFRSIARNVLKGKWGIAVVAGLIASVLGAIGSSGPELNVELNDGNFNASLQILVKMRSPVQIRLAAPRKSLEPQRVLGFLLFCAIRRSPQKPTQKPTRPYFIIQSYKCNLQTDTEVITYIMDYLIRRQGLTLEEAAAVVSASFWSTIEKKSPEAKEKEIFLRTVFSSLLITGPFSIVFGFNGGLMALNDRLKLRSMVVGEKDDKVFIASEEAAIRVMEPDAENIWAPAGGEPVIVKVKEGTF